MPKKRVPGICALYGCERPSVKRGHCDTHYARLLRAGKLRKISDETDEEYIMSRVDMVPESGCWLWNCGTRSGYGQAWRWDKSWVSHRLAYEIFIGQIPEGMLVCHKCDTHACCNPKHLFLGTSKDNTSDMFRKRRNNTQRQHGTSNAQAKLSAEQVDEIRRIEGKSCGQIAKLYGVTGEAIRCIRKGKSYVSNEREYVKPPIHKPQP